MKITSSICLITLIMLVSCSKDIEPTPFTFSKKFTGENNKTWKIARYEETLNGEIIDRFNVTCTSDDEFTFYANSERLLQIKTGSRKCDEDPTEPASIINVWSYNSATATLTMMIPAFSTEFSYPFFIREIDTDDLELEIFFDQENTASYRIIFDAIDEE